MKIKSFEDLECWKEARALTRTIYDYTKHLDFSKDFRLSGQITGASISIMNNICGGAKLLICSFGSKAYC